jgi:hypothetical protein
MTLEEIANRLDELAAEADAKLASRSLPRVLTARALDNYKNWSSAMNARRNELKAMAEVVRKAAEASAGMSWNQQRQPVSKNEQPYTRFSVEVDIPDQALCSPAVAELATHDMARMIRMRLRKAALEITSGKKAAEAERKLHP